VTSWSEVYRAQAQHFKMLGNIAAAYQGEQIKGFPMDCLAVANACWRMENWLNHKADLEESCAPQAASQDYPVPGLQLHWLGEGPEEMGNQTAMW